MTFIKQHAAGIIMGICITVTVFAVFGIYQISATAADAQNKVNQVIQLINQAQNQPTK